MTTSKYVAYAYNRGSSNSKVKGWIKIIIFGIDREVIAELDVARWSKLEINVSH